MKAVIMAGGEGKRLRQLFPGIPKALVKINTVPVLEHQINNLSDCGIKDIVVAIGYRGDLIKEYFGTGSAWGVHIDYFCEPHPLGTAGALYYLQDCLSQDFLLLYGDLVLNLDFNRLISFHYRKKASATLVAHPNSHPYDSDLLTVDEDDRVISILGKDAPRPCCYRNLVNAGVFVLQRAILRHLAAGNKLDVEKNLLKPNLGKEKIYAYRTTEYIHDMGTPERYRLVEQHIRSGIVAAKNLSRKQKAIFLDRDGTVNDYAGLISKPEELRVDNEVYRALREITRSEYISIIITNQPVVARNNCSLNDLHYIHACLETMLGRQQVYVDDILFCPHHPDQGYPEENKAFKIDCECRKPKTGLIDLAVKKYNIDLQQSYFIGDSTVDIKTGHNAGLTTILLDTGLGGRDGKYAVEPHYQMGSLYQAVKHILSRSDELDFTEQIKNYLDGFNLSLARLDLEQINLLIRQLLQVYMRQGRVYIFGNGGSAATASHFVADFNKGVSENLQTGFRFISLNDNMPYLLAIANDYDYSQVFKLQLQNHLQAGDLVIGISGSGNSANVLSALDYANSRGAMTAALVGFDGGQAKDIAQLTVIVPVYDMQTVEDIHLTLNHLMMKIIKKYLEGQQIDHKPDSSAG